MQQVNECEKQEIKALHQLTHFKALSSIYNPLKTTEKLIFCFQGI